MTSQPALPHFQYCAGLGAFTTDSAPALMAVRRAASVTSGRHGLDAVEKAHSRLPDGDLMGRWRAVGTALRRWAVDHPHEHALLYGSPVPDYEARAERTNQPGTRVQVLLVRLLSDAKVRGQLAGSGGDADLARLAEAAGGPLLGDEFFEGSGIDGSRCPDSRPGPC